MDMLLGGMIPLSCCIYLSLDDFVKRCTELFWQGHGLCCLQVEGSCYRVGRPDNAFEAEILFADPRWVSRQQGELELHKAIACCFCGTSCRKKLLIIRT